MLGRALLKDLGFSRGAKDWGHEVWHYNGEFWVHFGDYDQQRWPNSSTHVNGDKINRKEFLHLFIERVKEICHESHIEYPEPY